CSREIRIASHISCAWFGGRAGPMVVGHPARHKAQARRWTRLFSAPLIDAMFCPDFRSLRNGLPVIEDFRSASKPPARVHDSPSDREPGVDRCRLGSLRRSQESMDCARTVERRGESGIVVDPQIVVQPDETDFWHEKLFSV